MRAVDCVHPAHEDMHLTGSDDDDLLEGVKRHRDQYHPEMNDDQIRDYIAQNAYDE
jgi:hypothetical protein